jgi:hypothetical protein
LGISLENSKGKLELHFPFEKLALKQNPANNRLFSSTPPSQTYLLQLSSEAINDFKKLQKQLEKSEENTFDFSVDAKLNKQKSLTQMQKREDLFMNIELKLEQNGIFFTLIDNVEIKHGKSEL